MRELLRNAWMGWLAMSDRGKLGALLLLIFLLAWLWKLGSKRQKELIWFGALLTGLCIFPLTAACLMLYQTRFYDYEWIWTLVPVTGILACGGTLLLEQLDKTSCGKGKKLAIAGMALMVLLLCGRLGNPRATVRDVGLQRREVAQVLEKLNEATGGSVLLWAPKEVMEHARSLDANVNLLYGRNMWQKHLNAFCYDGYAQEQRDLYVWMQLACAYQRLDVPVPADLDVVGEAPKAGTTLEGISCIRKAMELGATQILLPGSLSEESMDELERELGIKPVRLEQYWLLSCNQGSAKASTSR
ncbi:MAG: hypothetical protein IKQ25_00195 [Lachnospiraceae bacterium]|nr:hypothetical protein [Lachnospiraceae bacterium]